jgi:hypothetical protein
VPVLAGNRPPETAEEPQNRDGAWIRAEIDKILAEAADANATEEASAKLFDTLVEEPLRPRRDRLARLQAALSEVEAEEATAKTAETIRSRARVLRGRTWPQAPGTKAEGPRRCACPRRGRPRRDEGQGGIPSSLRRSHRRAAASDRAPRRS